MQKGKIRRDAESVGLKTINQMADFADAGPNVVRHSIELFKGVQRFDGRWLGDQTVLAAAAFYAAYAMEKGEKLESNDAVEGLIDAAFGEDSHIRSKAKVIVTIGSMMDLLGSYCRKASVGKDTRELAQNMLYDSISTGIYTRIAAARETVKISLFMAMRHENESSRKFSMLGLGREEELTRIGDALVKKLRLHYDVRFAFSKNVPEEELEWALRYALEERKYAQMLTVANALGWSEEEREPIKRAMRFEIARENGIA